MNCIEFEYAVDCAVETRERISSAALEHASSCLDCRSVWERHQQLELAITAWRFAEPSAGLTDAVLAELAASSLIDERDAITDLEHCDLQQAVDANDSLARPSSPIESRRAARSRSSSFAMSSVAACMIAVIIFGWRLTVQNREPQPRNVASSIVQTVDQIGSGWQRDMSNSLTAVFSDLRSEYRELAGETTSVARDMVSAIPLSAAMTTLPDAEEIELLPNASDLDRIWRPIGSQVESAFGFLWQAIPREVPAG